MDLGIKNKTVLITGASQGIGKNISELFSRNKTKCIMVARNIKKLEKLKKLDKNIKETKYINVILLMTIH